MICSDVDMLVHPYLDGELVADERLLIERHVAACSRCGELVGHESTFKANLRARLRPRGLRAGDSPPAPEALVRRVTEALDDADRAGAGPPSSFGRFVAPALGALATAAAVALFFGSGWGRLSMGTGNSRGDSPIVEEAIAGHMKNLPVEIGGTDDDISRWMRGKVAVAVRPPNFHMVALGSPARPRLIGARISHLASRDAGQITYQMGLSQLTVYVFDPAGWELSAPSQGQGPNKSRTLKTIDGREVYLTERAGYSVAVYVDRGVGYAVASDLGEDALLAVVEAALRD